MLYPLSYEGGIATLDQGRGAPNSDGQAATGAGGDPGQG
jgi:hypothetical protein